MSVVDTQTGWMQLSTFQQAAGELRPAKLYPWLADLLGAWQINEQQLST